MSAFKDALAADMHVFLSEDEFASRHIINGISMPAMIDDIELSERTKQHSDEHYDGLYLRRTFVYVRATDFGELPKHGAKFLFDGKKYEVVSAADEDGIYGIEIGANSM